LRLRARNEREAASGSFSEVVMPVCRTLIVFFACACLSWADEVKTLAGKKITGTVIAISDKEIVVKTDGGDVKTPLAEVLALDLRAVAGLPDNIKYTELRLLDESVLRCKEVLFEGRQLKVTLHSEQTAQVPMASVISLLRDAQNKALRKEWDAILAESVKRDRLVILSAGALNALVGTFGEVDAKKQTVQFRVEDLNQTINRALDKTHGMIYYRTEQLKNNPVCYVMDAMGNTLAALKVELQDKTFTVTTVGGIVVKYQAEQLARLDYNLGKLKYLSDVEPSRVVERSGAGLIIAHRKDANLDGEPIVLDRAYPKGLSLHAYTELEYKLDGKYKEFYVVLGVDSRVGSESQAKVTIEYDGRKVFSEVITAKSLRVLPEDARDIRNVNRLRIIVSSSNLLDLHDHVTLADAKISQ
jgi:hypothetical protein